MHLQIQNIFNGYGIFRIKVLRVYYIVIFYFTNRVFGRFGEIILPKSFNRLGTG